MRETDERETEHTGESPSPGHRDQGQVDKDVLSQRDTASEQERDAQANREQERSKS